MPDLALSDLHTAGVSEALETDSQVFFPAYEDEVYLRLTLVLNQYLTALASLRLVNLRNASIRASVLERLSHAYQQASECLAKLEHDLNTLEWRLQRAATHEHVQEWRYLEHLSEHVHTLADLMGQVNRRLLFSIYQLRQGYASSERWSKLLDLVIQLMQDNPLDVESAYPHSQTLLGLLDALQHLLWLEASPEVKS